MKVYDVCFDWADYTHIHNRVCAENKQEVRQILRDQYGKVKVRYIEEDKYCE